MTGVATLLIIEAWEAALVPNKEIEGFVVNTDDPKLYPFKSKMAPALMTTAAAVPLLDEPSAFPTGELVIVVLFATT